MQATPPGDTVARQRDIELLDTDSGYLCTAWLYGISGGSYMRYRGRLTVKYREIKQPDKLEVRIQAGWLENARGSVWISGFDGVLERDE